MERTLYIYQMSDEEATGWAVAELRKYLSRVTEMGVEVRRGAEVAPGVPGIRVGVFTAFPEPIQQRASGHPFDDEIYIEVGEAGGIVAGVNPRSVLLAVYRYLTELGFRWVRPGEDGEVIPAPAHLLERRVSVHETPSYRHRCVAIEGASR